MLGMQWDDPQIRALIRLALDEDVGDADITTNSCVPEGRQASGYFLTRQPLILAGTPLLPLLYETEELVVLFADGTGLDEEQAFARVRGSARKLLTLERTALNLLQRTCGIATYTRRFVEALRGTRCSVLDTRKTSPGMRLISKLSVRAGGGINHRMGLYDAVLIKNNHIAAAGGARQALVACRSAGMASEIEVRDFDELEEALQHGAEHVLLDNFTPEQVGLATRRIRGRAKVEVSGNISLDTVRAYAEAGADFASVGALTHSAPAADISFRLE